MVKVTGAVLIGPGIEPDGLEPITWLVYRPTGTRALTSASKAMRAVQPFENACRPEAIRVPVLVIVGDDDQIAVTAEVIRYAARIPHAHLAVLPE